MVANYPVSSARVKECSQGKHISMSGQFRETSSFPRRRASRTCRPCTSLKRELLSLSQSWNAGALG